MNYTPTPGHRLCVVRSCREHAHDDTWTHKPPRREQPVTAHLRPVRRAA